MTRKIFDNAMGAKEVRKAMNKLMVQVNVPYKISVAGNEHVPFKTGDLIFDLMIEKKKIDGKEEPFFNATDFVKQHNKKNGSIKRVPDWKRSKRFKELMKIHGCDFNTRENKLIYVEKDGQRDRNMVHKDLFYSLCVWLDARYEVAISELLNAITDGVSLAVLVREIEKQANKEASDAMRILKDKLAEEGSGFAPWTYSTINRWINAVATDGTITSGIVDHNTLENAITHKRGEIAHNVDLKIWAGIKSGLSGREIKEEIKIFLKVG